MNLSKEQRDLLTEYNVTVSDDIRTLLLDLDAKITEIGFNSDYSLNKIGLKLQKLYDDIYLYA